VWSRVVLTLRDSESSQKSPTLETNPANLLMYNELALYVYTSLLSLFSPPALVVCVQSSVYRVHVCSKNT